MSASLLIGLDGSNYCSASTQFGIRWAKRYGTSLKGVAVVDEVSICAPGPVPLGGGAAKRTREKNQLSDAHHKADLFLEQFARECQQAGVRFETGKKVGQPEQQLLLEAQAHDAILMGQETFYHFMTQDEPDETAIYLVKHAPRPTLLIPAKIPEPGTVIIAWDGSVQAARAMSSFVALRIHQGCEVHVLTIHKDHQVAGEVIDRAMRYLGHHQVNAHRQMHITTHDTGDFILNKVTELRAELLVMGAYGKSGLKEFFFGSVTKNLLKHCPVPILLDH